ncbi:M24 family metallopeptidase [Bacillota bacterium Meth-B3]
MRDDKLKCLRARLGELGAGAAILWRPEELVALWGYHPFWGKSVAVVPAQGEAAIYMPDGEPAVPPVADVRVTAYPAGMMPCSPWDLLFDAIAANLSRRREKPVAWAMHGDAALSGVAAETPVLPDDWPERLASLGTGEPLDLTGMLRGLLARKEPDERPMLFATHEAAALGVEAFYACLKPGVSELEVQCEAERAVACFAGQKRFSRAWAQVQSGANGAAAGRYNQSTGKRLAGGELVLLELAVCVDGYWADITRTGVVGEPTAAQRRMYTALSRACQAAQSAARPDVLARDVYAAAAQVLRAEGLLEHFPHALGHGVGYRYHEYLPRLTPYSDDVLQRGMVITLEPGVYSPSFGGMRIEDNYWITERGCERISIGRGGLKGELHD